MSDLNDPGHVIAFNGKTDDFRCFMVDFIGLGGAEVLSDSDITEMADGASPNKKLPTLYSAVEAWLVLQKAKITDRGYGVSSWSLGAYCTPGEAWLLTKKARKQFSRAVSSGLLQVYIQPWSMESKDCLTPLS